MSSSIAISMILIPSYSTGVSYPTQIHYNPRQAFKIVQPATVECLAHGNVDITACSRAALAKEACT
jgi:hypothetical protein